MINKLLIANRGEIAVRIMRTARRLGIETVAVYSDADRDALHVECADEALRIGPPPAAQSYLDQKAVIAAALQTGAEAIHPGYGFLAENPEFAEAVDNAGLIFVGPPAKAIRAMGLKDEAKRLMQKAGVPLLPGYHGHEQDFEQLAAEAERIGYPVLVKPVAGGGGKGMRRVANRAELLPNLAVAKREAVSAFGDGHLLLEKYLDKARHIEVQVMADTQGNIIHLFERDCSLQRRHQKVIEESPAPGMPVKMRDGLCRAAIAAAKSVNYVGAGTVEFIADVSEGLKPDRFYFMEMNTRLQVEHPVTEMVTGLDLVELQLRVASGEPLPLRQADVSLTGHGVEARLYAEDPEREFQPQTGRISQLTFPEGPRLRADLGFRAGDMVTPYYDPMLGKLAVHASTREVAIGNLAGALAEGRIAGCRTNLTFLNRLLRHPAFAKGEVDTALITRELAALVAPPEPPIEAVAGALLYAGGYLDEPLSQSPFETLRGFRLWDNEPNKLKFLLGSEVLEYVLDRKGNRFTAVAAGNSLEFHLLSRDNETVRLDCGGRIVSLTFFHHDNVISIATGGARYDFGLLSEIAETAEGDGGNLIISPVPGLVRKVVMATGQKISRGETVIIVEAMKMEFSLKAERDGLIKEVHVSEGQQIAEGTKLVTIGDDSG